MAAAPLLSNLPITHPDSTDATHSTSEPWLEPFLLRHSSWYRRHRTKAGKHQSASNPNPKRTLKKQRRSRGSSSTMPLSNAATAESILNRNGNTTTVNGVPSNCKSSIDEDVDVQWKQVEEEYKRTSMEHERQRSVREV